MDPDILLSKALLRLLWAMTTQQEVRDAQWIAAAVDAARKHRAMIVAWETFLYTAEQQMSVLNGMPIPGSPEYKPTTPCAILAAKRQLLASFVEAPQKLGSWINYLQITDFDCSEINQVRKSVRTTLDKVKNWHDIRNLAAHHSDFTSQPDEVIAWYEAIGRVPVAEINEVWDAILRLGILASSLTAARI